MARATWLLCATSVAGVSLSLWLYLENRALRAELAPRAPSHAARPVAAAPTAPHPTDPSPQASRAASPIASASAAPAPSLPATPKETRMDRRARRTDEFAAMFGRLDGESEDDYRARILPMLKAGLAVPRMRVEEQRKIAEEKAHVTPEQSARLD
jgi:hypothetical protein